MPFSVLRAAIAAAVFLLPAALAAQVDFEIPAVSALDASPERGAALLLDEETGGRSEVELGEAHTGGLVLVAVERDRVVLQKMTGSRPYLILPVHGAERAARASEHGRGPADVGSARGAPRDPYASRTAPARREVDRVPAPAPARGASDRGPRGRAGEDAAGDARDGAREPADGSASQRRTREPRPPAQRDEPLADAGDGPELRDPYRDGARDGGGAGETRGDGAGGSGADRGGQESARSPERDADERDADDTDGADGADGADGTREGQAAPRREVLGPVELRRADLDRALADLESLEDEIEIRPEGDGVRVKALASDSFIYDLGLREGDFVRSVAGRRIDSVEAAAGLYAHLARTDEVAVEIERGEREIELVVELVR